MSRFVIGATWDDAPHLTQESKDALWASIPLYQREARSKGIPQLGSGAIYPFSETDVRVEDFKIPEHFVRGYALDTALGGTTAGVWGAHDRQTDTLYVYSIYKRQGGEVPVHVEAVRSRGLWMPGVADAADIADTDRTQFITLYRRQGCNLELPDKAVETGIQDVYDRLSAGKLRVFASCVGWFEEFRLYRRDVKGRVVKQNDHYMDATRYLVRSGMSRMKLEHRPDPDERFAVYRDLSSNTSWMH